MAHEMAEGYELPLRRLEGVPSRVKTISLVLLVLGAVAFVGALMADPGRAWKAYLYNWLYWSSIAQGAFMLSVAVTLARGLWARPVRRIAMSFGAFLPIAFVLFLPLLFQGEHLFTWYGKELHGAKEVYLDFPFLAVRNVIGLLILTVLSMMFIRASTRPDAGLVRDLVPQKLRGQYDRLTRGWRGQAQEERIATKRMHVLGPILGFAWAIVFSIVAFDFVMSQEDHWFSTLIGPYYFMGGFQGGVALTVLLTLYYRRKLDLEDYIQTPQLHDLGKLLFAFSVFWAYMFWSQYIVIWYGKLTWEQIFLVRRMIAPFGGLSLLLVLCLFVLPFFGLLGAAPKKNPVTLTLFASVILFGLWIERYILVYPSFYSGAETVPFGWQEIGTALAFAGLFLGSVFHFGTRYPVMQMWQPASEVAAPGEEPPGTEAATAE